MVENQVYRITADTPAKLQAGETLLFDFNVVQIDIDIGDFRKVVVGFAARSGTRKLLDFNSQDHPNRFQIDDRSELSVSGTATIDTLALIPYVSRRVDIGWYAVDGANVSYSVRSPCRILEPISIPDVDIGYAFTLPQLLLPTVQSPAIERVLDLSFAIGQNLSLTSQSLSIRRIFAFSLGQQLGASQQSPALNQGNAFSITQRLCNVNQPPSLEKQFAFEVEQRLGAVDQSPEYEIALNFSISQQLGTSRQSPFVGRGFAFDIGQSLSSSSQSPALRQLISLTLPQNLGSTNQAIEIEKNFQFNVGQQLSQVNQSPAIQRSFEFNIGQQLGNTNQTVEIDKSDASSPFIVMIL